MCASIGLGQLLDYDGFMRTDIEMNSFSLTHFYGAPLPRQSMLRASASFGRSILRHFGPRLRLR